MLPLGQTSGQTHFPSRYPNVGLETPIDWYLATQANWGKGRWQEGCLWDMAKVAMFLPILWPSERRSI